MGPVANQPHETKLRYVGFEVLTVVTMKKKFFWDVLQEATFHVRKNPREENR
jgi:hypothetical protein